VCVTQKTGGRSEAATILFYAPCAALDAVYLRLVLLVPFIRDGGKHKRRELLFKMKISALERLALSRMNAVCEKRISFDLLDLL